MQKKFECSIPMPGFENQGYWVGKLGVTHESRVTLG